MSVIEGIAWFVEVLAMAFVLGIGAVWIVSHVRRGWRALVRYWEGRALHRWYRDFGKFGI